MDLFAPTALASRFVEPLTHPVTALGGGILSASFLEGRTLEVVVEAAWRLLRLLLAL